jgi:hypothetical protein
MLREPRSKRGCKKKKKEEDKHRQDMQKNHAVLSRQKKIDKHIKGKKVKGRKKCSLNRRKRP